MIKIEKSKLFLMVCFLPLFPLDRLSAQTTVNPQTKAETQITPKPQTETIDEPVVYSDPETLLLDLLDKVSKLGNQEIEIAEKVEAFHDLLSGYIDLKNISRFVLGKYWRKINDKEKEEFISTFSNYILLTFVPKINSYLSQGVFQIERNDERRPGFHIITSKYTETNKEPVDVAWIIKKNKETESYKIFNIQTEGISFIILWRDQFNSIIKQQGINGLIDELKDLNFQKKEKLTRP